MPSRDSNPIDFEQYWGAAVGHAVGSVLAEARAIRAKHEKFLRLQPEERIAALRGKRIERTLQIARAAIDEEKRTVVLSISSELPYERWWGIEILDHGRKSIRTERLEAGLSILVDHVVADLVGKSIAWEITSEKQLQLVARFGRSARAQEVFADVLDGIRDFTSTAYLIHDLVLEKQEENVSTYRVTDWEPLEGSLVSVPADPSVGVGRQLDLIVPAADPPTNEGRILFMPNEKTPEQIAAETKAAADRAAKDAVERERKRVADIRTAGNEFAQRGGPELANELIGDPEASVETFRQRMLAKLSAGTPALNTAEPARPVGYGAGARQIIRRGGALKAFRSALRFTDGSEIDPLECAYRAGQWLLATVGQREKSQRWCAERGIDTALHRVMTTDVGSAGGYLVPDEMEQAIIDLRESYGLARRLARRRPMASDTKSVPKRTGGVTAYFVEEDNAGVTASDKGWGNVNLVAKNLAALSIISQNLEEDAIIDVIDDLAMEQAYAFAKKEDECWLIGDGTSTYGGMTGLMTLFNASALASRFNAATNHDTFPEFDAADLSGVMGAVADFPGLMPAWVCSKTFAETVLNRIKATAGGNTVQILEGRPRYNYLGYDAFTSELMPKDGVGDVSDITVALFGDFSLSSTYGDRRGIVIQVLRERYAEKLQVGVLGSERFHIVNHDVGTTAVKGPVGGLYGD